MSDAQLHPPSNPAPDTADDSLSAATEMMACTGTDRANPEAGRKRFAKPWAVGELAGASETPAVVTIGPGEGDRQSFHPVRTLPSIFQGLVVLSRPRQWIKNLLVFAAPGAAGVLVHRYVLWHSAAAFAIFCIAASGAYFFNDAIDAKADRLHPVKRFRPVASGAVPFALAIFVGGAMLISAVGLGALLAGRDLAVVMALYAIINVGYSLGLKNEAIVDLALVSAGFVLRAIAGGVATGVALSHWFIIVTTFGSLLVVTGKRSGLTFLKAVSK